MYLGATVSKEDGGTEDIHNRVVKARGVFLRLKKVWSSHSISRRTKVRLYKTLAKPVLMHGCETWKMNKCDENKLDVFRGRCLRRRTTAEREKGKKRHGRTGVRYKWQRLTEMVGGIVLRPYVPHGTKKIHKKK